MLDLAEPLERRHVVCTPPEQRQQAALHGALVELDVVTDAETADHVEQLLQRHPFGVEQQLVAGVEDPQVAEHLSLRGEERRVAAVSGRQRLDVVGHLALEKGLRVTSGERELAALGAVKDPAAGRRRLVFGLRDRN